MSIVQRRGGALLEGIEFHQECGIRFLETYPFAGREFVYADPPYLQSTRRSRARYQYELSEADHRRLLGVLLEIPCPVLLSGYPSDLYDGLLAKWNREEFQVMTRGHTWATEVLWFNYPRPAVLHDLTKVGANFRERWRITKKRRRWVDRLQRMPELERATLFAALVDVMGSAAAARAVSGAGGSATAGE